MNDGARPAGSPPPARLHSLGKLFGHDAPEWSSASPKVQAKFGVRNAGPYIATSDVAGPVGGGRIARGGQIEPLVWRPAGAGLPADPLTCSLWTTTTLYVGAAGGGVLASPSDGENVWERRSSGLWNKEVHALTGDDSELYAGTTRGGVFRSVDGGEQWNPVRGQPTPRSPNVPDTTVRSLLAIREGIKIVLAGTQQGLFAAVGLDGGWSKITAAGDVVVFDIFQAQPPTGEASPICVLLATSAGVVAVELDFLPLPGSGGGYRVEGRLLWRESTVGRATAITAVGGSDGMYYYVASDCGVFQGIHRGPTPTTIGRPTPGDHAVVEWASVIEGHAGAITAVGNVVIATMLARSDPGAPLGLYRIGHDAAGAEVEHIPSTIRWPPGTGKGASPIDHTVALASRPDAGHEMPPSDPIPNRLLAISNEPGYAIDQWPRWSVTGGCVTEDRPTALCLDLANPQARVAPNQTVVIVDEDAGGVREATLVVKQVDVVERSDYGSTAKVKRLTLEQRTLGSLGEFTIGGAEVFALP